MIKKDKKISFRLPESRFLEVKKQIAYDNLGFQELFDYLVVSGVVFRKPEILDLIKRKKDIYRQIMVQDRLSRFGKAEKPKREKDKTTILTMYKNDFVALKQFCIEENVSQSTLFRILFLDGYLEKDKGILSVIKKAKKFEVSKRAKAVARLANDKFIYTIEPGEAQKILDELTKNYDNKEGFSQEIQDHILKRLNSKDEDEKINDELNKKLAHIRRQRTEQINRIVDDKLGLDSDEIDT